MKSVPPEPSDLVNRLRQQLILAQVRLMELEDERDGLAPKIAELEQLLAAAQLLSDRKLDEAAHLGKVLADTQAHSEHLRALQAQTSGELAAARADFADRLGQLETELLASRSEAADRLARLQQLEAEHRAVISTRSWRWTAWLRPSKRKSDAGPT